METLNQLLGHQPDDKLLIVSCDDLGISHASNVGVFKALRDGWATASSLMVPGPWAREAAARYRGEDVGVHLTLTAEHEHFRWGPITHSPSLLGGDGGFPRTAADMWDHADLDETRRECRAQIERAVYWGFDVTHLNSHINSLILRPEFFDIALDMAVDFNLPLRLPNETSEELAGFPFRRLASEAGVLFPGHVVSFTTNASESIVERAIRNLEPGVTEFVFRPADDTPELRAMTSDWPSQITQLELLSGSNALSSLIEQAGVKRIGYRSLRDAQRQRKAT